MNPLLDYPTYLERFFPKDDEGYDLIAPAFYFGFYFPDGYRADKRQAAAAVCDDYWSLCGHELKWMIKPIKCTWQPIPEGYTMQTWLDAYPKADWVWEMIFHSGRINVEAAQYQILGVGNGTRTHGYSYLYLFVPVTWFVEHPDQHPITLYQRWAARLQARHGTAGLGLVPPEDTPRRKPVAGVARAFAEFCPGIELCDPLWQWGLARHGLLSPNWLSLLDSAYVEALGGEAALRAALAKTALPEPIGVHPFEGGLILSAGEHPRLYEGEQLETPPEAYRVVARVLKPIRCNQLAGFWGCHKRDSLDWLARFD